MIFFVIFGSLVFCNPLGALFWITWSSLGLSFELLGAFWSLLESSWGPLLGYLGVPGASWSTLLGLLGAAWSVLEQRAGDFEPKRPKTQRVHHFFMIF